MIYETGDEGGVLLEYTHTGERNRDTQSASLTARGVVRCEVRVDNELIDVVYAGQGGSHTWWTMGGNKLLPIHGLFPGQTLKVTADGRAAFRIEWMD